MTVLSAQRVGRITGSRVAAILGVSPYNDRAGVMREMVRQRLGAAPEFVGNIATEYGTAHELEATVEYERYRGVTVYSDQECVVHPVIDYLAATPDGLVGEAGLLEVKCPYRAGYTSITDRPDYFEQVQLQLEVTDREWCDFVIWRPTGISVDRVGRDPGWLTRRGPILDAFIAEYEDVIYDTDRHSEFLDAPGVPDRDDFEWQLAALDYLEATAAAARAAVAKEIARARLVELAGDEPAKGAGVSVTRAERKGTVDYRQVYSDFLDGTVDLEPYRKPSTIITTVRPVRLLAVTDGSEQ